ncbi:MAG: hypothetical protein NTV88_02015 [Candidatus Micrarchaeota archaeon]|nr:hypothetical protein [Candidatus Micrarchaeota archaeon]
MKGLIFVLAVIGVLLFAGCASGPQVSTAPAPTPQPVAPAKNTTQQNVPAPGSDRDAHGCIPSAGYSWCDVLQQCIRPWETNCTAQAAENQAPQMSPDSCKVEFQKDSSSVYYVMVKTESAKALTVKCPNGDMAILKGQLWFCEDISVPNNAIAYLDGKECGTARFLAPNVQPGKLACSVTVTPNRISMGKSADVTVMTSTGDKQVKVSYTCGDSEKTQTRSGLLTDGSICTFNTPGAIEIDAKMDGVICASTMLQVFENAKDCSVFGSTYESKNGVHTYTAQLAVRGYSGSENMLYYCYGTNNQQPVGSMENSTDFITTVKCSGNAPLTEAVKVKVGNDECGYIELPSAQ